MKSNVIRIPILFLIAVFGLVIFSGIVIASNGDIKQKQVSDKPYGEYLAGRHAASQNDLHAAADFHQRALVLDPENLMILKRSFTVFIADGRYGEALRVAHKLNELDFSDSVIKLFLFLEKFKSKDFEMALAQLEKLSDAGVYGLFKPLFRSWVLLALDKPDEAEENMVKLIASGGFKDFKKFQAGLFYDHLGKTQLAENMYSNSLIVTDAMSLRIIEAYGILLRRIGRDGDARQLYLNYLEKAPDNAKLKRALNDLDNDIRPQSYVKSETDAIAEIFYSAANFLMQDNIRTPAVSYLRFANYMKEDFYISDYLLGQIFEANKYYEGALERYGRVTKNHPLYFDTKLQMAWILEKTDKLDEAINAMEKLGITYPDNREVLAALGDINRMNSRFDQAGIFYTEYIDSLKEFEDKHWSIFYTRGIVYEQAKKWQLAENDFLKALDLKPDQPQVLNYLAYSWVDKGLHIERATKMLERAVELRPHDGYIIDSLGWALYRTGDMSKAVEYLEKAVMLQTDDWAINDHLGDAYWAVGRKYEARFQWRHALSLMPEEELISKIKIKIKDGN